jgi:hypothetical protein
VTLSCRDEKPVFLTDRQILPIKLNASISQVIKSRCQRAHPALDLSSGSPKDDGTGLETVEALQIEDDASLLFDKTAVADALRASGKDVTRLSMPFVAKATPDSLLVGHAASHAVTDGSASVDMSVDSSPGMSRDVSRRNTVFTAGPRGQFCLLACMRAHCTVITD